MPRPNPFRGQLTGELRQIPREVMLPATRLMPPLGAARSSNHRGPAVHLELKLPLTETVNDHCFSRQASGARIGGPLASRPKIFDGGLGRHFPLRVGPCEAHTLALLKDADTQRKNLASTQRPAVPTVRRLRSPDAAHGKPLFDGRHTSGTQVHDMHKAQATRRI